MSLIHVTSENFEKALNAAPNLAVVDFFATWCGPCKMLAPVLEEAAEEMPEITFYKVDVDECPDLAQQFQVMSVPTLVFFKGREPVKKSVGALSFEELEEMIQSVTGTSD
ncbi:MAG: thioredoxin [Fusicatenibacter sp.]|nr:thioredoxin [Fusicatenibacter sp.]